MIKRWMYVILFPAFISAYTNPIDCDFEKDSCSWLIEGFRRISYDQFNGTGGWNDHMRRNGMEWYLYFDATNVSYATLKSPQTTIQGLQCLNFWYRVRGSDESQIQVIVHDIDGGNDSTIWEKSYRYDTGWNLAAVEIDVQYSTSVTIFIRGRTGRSYSKIGIDDVVVKLASCLDCNFLDGLCNWEGKEWTVPTSKFNYAVTECKSLRHPSVLSSALEIYPGEKCLSFKYQTKEFQREKIYIDIQSYHENQWSTVWEGGWRQQFQGWNEIGVNINLGNKSRISIRFVHRDCFNATYYISSISLKKQSCTEITTTTSTAARAVTTTISSSPNGKVNYSANATDSSSSTSTTNSTSISTETDAPNSSATTISIADDTSCTTAETTPTPSTETEHAIIGIGSIVVIAVVVLAAGCYYRRNKHSNSRTNIYMNTGLYETHTEVFSQDNYDHIIRITSGRENNMLDRVYNNEEPQYLTIEE